ncbi:tail fiber protein [Acaryochloris sp. IP29b_bin.137]|uniref:phage tail protein n=1 Tax=Acaryochloris sp. IP29b_bin.137 TaxID=2969217 RepID=UPI00263708BB|nr:tail fiber protein [Acaryochloris sp. IP29b_bin.137]
MTEPYLGEIRIFGFNFAPRNWAQCDGSTLSISQNQALYSILGTTYGGDGRTSFALPDLRSRTPIHAGDSGTSGSSSRSPGTRGGEETVALSINQIPSHTHTISASADAPNQNTGVNTYLAAADIWAEPDPLVTMENGTFTSTGSGQGHENMQPFLTLNYCIALVGTFPPRN